MNRLRFLTNLTTASLCVWLFPSWLLVGLLYVLFQESVRAQLVIDKIYLYLKDLDQFPIEDKANFSMIKRARRYVSVDFKDLIKIN